MNEFGDKINNLYANEDDGGNDNAVKDIEESLNHICISNPVSDTSKDEETYKIPLLHCQDTINYVLQTKVLIIECFF